MMEQRNETGKNNSLIVFLVIVILLLCGVVCYLVYNLGKGNNVENNDNNSGSAVTETIDYTVFVTEGKTLAKTEEKEVQLNGKKHKLAFVYTYDKNSFVYQDENYETYSYYLTIVYDGKVTDIKNLHVNAETTTNGLITNFGDRFVKYNTMKDASNKNDYLSILIEYYDTYEDYSVEYYATILNENAESLYEYRNTKCYGVEILSSGKQLPYVEQTSNYLLVLNVTPITDSNPNGSADKTKITINNGNAVKENIKIAENYSLTDGC